MGTLKIFSCLILVLASAPSEPSPTVGPNESPEELQAEAGGSVLLRCQSLRAKEITALKWSRSNMTEYVFFYRDKRPYERYQNPMYQGRVQPADPLMSSSNLSIILSNATMDDSGTFYCKVGLARGKPEETLHTIHLEVVPATDPTDGSSEDGGSGDATLRNHWSVVAAAVAAVAVAAFAAGVCIYKRKEKSQPYYQDPNGPL